MIEVLNIEKKYGLQEILKGFDLNLKPGMITAVVGENGAGKSTLFKCLAGLESYTGEIKSPFPALKDTIGFVPTNPTFLSKITGTEYLQFVCNARKIKETKFSEKNIFNLPLDRYATDYSTGMKKKLALTAILMIKNEVYLLDEPFNGMDIQSNILFYEILQRLKEKGKIIVLSSHIFSAINDTCDYMYYLKNGKISQEGPRESFKMIEENIKSDLLNHQLNEFFN